LASSKQKTTWSKIQRESKRRDKRAEKAARKVARKADAELNPADEFGTPHSGLELEPEGHEEQTSEEAVQDAA
jgi:hypothetical protein